MAHFTFKDMGVKLDNASGTLTDISGSVNSASFDGSMTMLEDTGIGDTEGTYLPGVARGTVTINGFVNSTTRAIMAPLVGQHTSVAKTVQVLISTGQYLNGEAYPSAVTISGAPDTLELFNSSWQADGGFNSTSVSL